MIPRFLIDDTAGISDARQFVTHTQTPRFVGEILPESEAGLLGVQLTGLPGHEIVTNIIWIDEPIFDADELIPSLAAAIDHHWKVRGQ